jgi:hypothetical protein
MKERFSRQGAIVFTRHPHRCVAHGNKGGNFLFVEHDQYPESRLFLRSLYYIPDSSGIKSVRNRMERLPESS